MAKLLELQTFSDERGHLTVLEKILPFDVKRLYYIYEVSSLETVRAGHRHLSNIQALVCIAGSCIISNNDGQKKERFVLDRPDRCLILDPEDWHTMHDFSSDAVLLVMASEYYDINDYIDEEYP